MATVYKKYYNSWQAIVTDKKDNTAGWTMTGEFKATTMFKGAVTSF